MMYSFSLRFFIAFFVICGHARVPRTYNVIRRLDLQTRFPNGRRVSAYMLFLVDQKSKREEGKKVDDLFAAGTMSRV
jgi:hypothetical protein